MKETLVYWDNANGYMESNVRIDENKFKLGEIYFENEKYSLRAYDKDEHAFYLKAEWK